MKNLMFVSGCLLTTAVLAEPIEIGSKLQVLWDDAIVDTAKTTASRIVHQPDFVGETFRFDLPWESNVGYCHIVAPTQAGDTWRMYYLSTSNYSARVRSGTVPYDGQCRVVGMIESRDGITWTRPDIGHGPSVILNERILHGCLDNFCVFRDTNPACPPAERYKATANFEFRCDEKTGLPTNYGCGPLGLECYVSPDGLHWTHRGYLLRDALFDTLNVAYWDAPTQEYRVYIRNAHCHALDRNGDTYMRDILFATSKDFKTWTKPRQIRFEEGTANIPLYTNVMSPYPRAPEISIGFPTRYVQRPKWTDTFDRLTGVAARKARMDPKRGGVPRYGLVTTDCAFMMTRDGLNFHREGEAFLRPGPEQPNNWRYGDCYPSVGLIPTVARRGTDHVYSFYVPEYGQRPGATGHRSLSRYEVRQDGFVSRHATYEDQTVVTKELVFTGTNMLVNFATSARGYVYVTIRDRLGAEMRSYELFGDRVDRSVGFDSDVLDLTDFTGKPVVITFTMSDADLYSFRFEGDTFRDHPRHHTIWGWWPQSWLKIVPAHREIAAQDGVTTYEVDGLGADGNASKFTCRFAKPKADGAEPVRIRTAVLLADDDPTAFAFWRREGYAVLQCQPSTFNRQSSTFLADAVNLGLAHSLLRSLTAPAQSATSNPQPATRNPPPATLFVGSGRGADLGAALGALDGRFAGYVLVGGGFADRAKTTLDNGRFLYRVKTPMAWVVETETPAAKFAFSECGNFAGVEKAAKKDFNAAALRQARRLLK